MTQASLIPEGTSTENAIGCPNCHGRGMTIFHEVKQIPVHSVLLMATREQAADYPRRDLRLGFCPACGFIGNVIFDTSVHEYSTSYEETQGFSPTFNHFARSLASQVVERYGLKGKRALEIGCGKGEFLSQLVEAGMGSGVGIDPAFVPERLESPVSDRLEFIQDFYDERHADLAADAIVCRHTLEHIAPTGQFMETLRKTVGDRKETLIFFELPDVWRVLKEGAFWDMYYEHCSYFSAGSLARVFRRSGFDVLDLWLDYGDQYIMIAARAADGPTSARLPLEDDLEALSGAVEAFPAKFREVSGHWRGLIERFHARGERFAIWGAGSKAVSFLTTLGVGDKVECLVDINPHKQGKYMPATAQRVAGPEDLKAYQPRHIIVMNPQYCEEIRADLARMDIEAELHPV